MKARQVLLEEKDIQLMEVMLKNLKYKRAIPLLNFITSKTRLVNVADPREHPVSPNEAVKKIEPSNVNN